MKTLTCPSASAGSLIAKISAPPLSCTTSCISSVCVAPPPRCFSSSRFRPLAVSATNTPSSLKEIKRKCDFSFKAADFETFSTEESNDVSEDTEETAFIEGEEPVMGSYMSRRKKLRMILNIPKKQKLVLKFLWLDKSIGLALDQFVPGYGPVPLSPYFFWPRKDAWEELKSTLEKKPWISRKRAIILLNQATDIINLWQQRNDDTEV